MKIRWYSAHRLIGSRIIESVAYCNQKLLAHLYLNSTQNTSVNWTIRLLLSLLCWPKVILISGGLQVTYMAAIFCRARQRQQRSVPWSGWRRRSGHGVVLDTAVRLRHGIRSQCLGLPHVDGKNIKLTKRKCGLLQSVSWIILCSVAIIFHPFLTTYIKILRQPE